MMKSRYKGIFFIIISAFSFALMNVLVRMSGDLPTIQKAFFRNFIALCIAAVILLKNRENISLPSGKGWWDMVGRSLCGTLGIFANFYAVDHLIVSDASMLNKLSPFFVLLFSFLMLKERMKPFQVACVFMAFIGTLFVIKPGVTGMRLIPSLVGVSGGLLAGMAYTYVRKLGLRGVSSSFIVLFFSGFSCVVSLPYILMHYSPMTMYQLFILLMAGIAASGGQFFITMAYTYAPGREISIYDYTQIIFVTGLSFVLLGQIPDSLSFVGYAVIIAASVIMFVYNGRESEKSD